MMTSLLQSKRKLYKNVISFGSKGNSDISETILGSTSEAKDIIEIVGLNKKLKFSLPLLGNANSINILAAISIVLKIGLPKKEIINSIKNLENVPGRLNQFEFSSFSLIDDTYNANPESVKNAIEVIKKFSKRKTKILILGDMFELGKNSRILHEQLGAEIAKSGIDKLITIGKHAKYLSQIVGSKNVSAVHFSDRVKMNKYLTESNIDNAVVLVKGSRGMKMEEFLETLKRKAV